jgi:hypothetical protein
MKGLAFILLLPSLLSYAQNVRHKPFTNYINKNDTLKIEAYLNEFNGKGFKSEM